MRIKTKVQKISAHRSIKRSGGNSKEKSPAGFKSIVVPIDFSETSLEALDYAVALAKEFGSQIHLIHVLEFPSVFNPASQPSYASWNKEAHRVATTKLAELVVQRVGELVPATSTVYFGRAHKVICESARETNADLIVISTHGFTGLKHMLLGSTAERVIQHAPCSVLIVRRQKGAKSKSIAQSKKFLVPTDFSKPADGALRSAVALAKQSKAQIHLLYVVPTHYAVGDYDMIDFGILATEQKEAGEKKLAETHRKLAAKGLTAKTHLRHGRPAVEINEAATEFGCDLIVISTHGRTGWEHAFLGSTAEEVVRHATCPVLVVRNEKLAAIKSGRKS